MGGAGGSGTPSGARQRRIETERSDVDDCGRSSIKQLTRRADRKLLAGRRRRITGRRSLFDNNDNNNSNNNNNNPSEEQQQQKITGQGARPPGTNDDKAPLNYTLVQRWC